MKNQVLHIEQLLPQLPQEIQAGFVCDITGF